MKRCIVLLLLVAGLGAASAKDIQAVFSYAMFDLPGQKPYIETYLSVTGNSVKYIPLENGKFQASIQVSLTYRQGEKISYMDKYNLLSPQLSDTSVIQFTFLDQKRVALDRGEYTLNLTVSDNNDKNNFAVIAEKIKIGFPPDELAVSDISFLESYKKASETSALTKNGYEMIPLANNFYPTPATKLIFYTEIYNADKILGQDPFLVNYYLESTDNGNKVPNMGTFKKETPRSINVLLAEFSIESLPTGNYNLVVEARNKTNDLLASKKVFFQRSNKNLVIKDEDLAGIDPENFARRYDHESVAEHIRSLNPISSEAESNFAANVIASNDLNRMQQYLVYFWQKRNPENAEKAWLSYEDEVKKVNYSYSTSLNKGYNTDRGRVYLKYGAPNNINKNDTDQEAYPYEIWHYYKLNNQSNRKFVFYNPSGAADEFELIHSDAIGELSDYRWKYKLLSRDPKSRPDNLDDVNPDLYFGDKIETDFD